MPIADHLGGPADGARTRIEDVTQIRFYAPHADRRRTGWVALARYVFVPPRDGKWCRYRYTGVHQVQGPVPGTEADPTWS